MQRLIFSKTQRIDRYYKEKSAIDDLKSPFYQQEVLNDILKKHFQNKKIKILDFGTGVGSNLETLIKGRYSSICAADISSKAIAICKKKYKNTKIISFYTLNNTKLPFENEKFDLVICTEVLEHVSNLPKVVSELKRVTSKKGHILISTPNYFNLAGIVKFLMDIFSKEKDWNPWGAHKGGYERLVFWYQIKLFFGKNLVVVEDHGRDMLLSWFYFFRDFFPDKLRVYFLLLPGKFKWMKFFSMNYYILLKKNEN